MQLLSELRDHFRLVRMVRDAAHTVIGLVLCLSIALIGWHLTEEGNLDAKLAITDEHLFFLNEISHQSLHLLCSSWFHLLIYFI